MIIGSDVAGIVGSVGDKVSRFSPGDTVYVETMMGGCAELVVVPEDRAARMPSGLTFEQAAAVPMAGVTALVAVRDDGRLQQGQTVLINGASGGVGTFAVQIARALGGEVTASCSPGAVELVRSLGADEVIDYTVDDPIDAGRTYDLIVNIGGTHSLGALRRTLNAMDPGGGRRFAARRAARPGQRRHPRGPHLTVRRAAVAVGLGQAERPRSRDPRNDDEEGELTPVIDRTYPLSQTPRRCAIWRTATPRGRSWSRSLMRERRRHRI